MDWYDPQVYGTVSDWVGIFATILTILGSFYFFMNDNKVRFKIAAYQIQITEKKNGAILVKGETNTCFWCVNLSKFSEAIYFENIYYKYTLVEKIIRFFKKQRRVDAISDGTLESLFEEMPDYEIVESRHRSKETIYLTTKIDNFAEKRFKKKNKKVILLATYRTSTGKKFKKRILYDKSYFEINKA